LVHLFDEGRYDEVRARLPFAVSVHSPYPLLPSPSPAPDQ
jgi:hypothetical protein